MITLISKSKSIQDFFIIFMLISHKILLESDSIHNICILYNKNDTAEKIALQRGSDLVICDLQTLKVLQIFPFQTDIVVMSVLNPKDKITLFIMLSDFRWFIVEIPDIIKSGVFSIYTRVSRRKLINGDDTLNSCSVGTSDNMTRSIRYKERQFPTAIHSKCLAISVIAGMIYIIPNNKEIFLIKTHYTSIIDMTFIGPTLNSLRLAVLGVHGNTRTILIFTVDIYNQDMKPEYEEEIDVGMEAYYLIPIDPVINDRGTFVVFTYSGLLMKIIAPRDVKFTLERSDTFATSIIVSHTQVSTELFLLLDASGGIFAVNISKEGRVVLERLISTPNSGGCIAYSSNKIVVSSPFNDLILYNFEILTNGCNITESHKISVTGPVWDLLYDNSKLFVASKNLSFLYQRVETVIIQSFDVGVANSIFSSGEFLCISYPFSTRIIQLNESYSQIGEVDIDYIKDEPTLAFGFINGNYVQVTPELIMVINTEKFKNSKKMDIENAFIICENIFVLLTDSFTVFDMNLNEKHSYSINNSKIVNASTDNKRFSFFTDQNEIYIFNENIELINKFTIPKKYSLSSIALSNNGRIFLGTFDGDFISFGDDNKLLVENVGLAPVKLRNCCDKLLVLCDTPFIYDKIRRNLDKSGMNDIVPYGESFAILTDNTLEIININTDVPQLPDHYSRDSVSNSPINPKSIVKLNENNTYLVKTDSKTLSIYYNDNSRLSDLSTREFDDDITFTKCFGDIILMGSVNNFLTVLDYSLNIQAKFECKSVPFDAKEVDNFVVVASKQSIDLFRLSRNDIDIESNICKCEYAVCVDIITCFGEPLIVVGEATNPIQIYKLGSNEESICAEGTGIEVSSVQVTNNIIFASNYSDEILILLFNGVSIKVSGKIKVGSNVLSMIRFRDGILYGTEYGVVGYIDVLKQDDSDYMIVTNRLLESYKRASVTKYRNINPDAYFEDKKVLQDCIFDCDNLLSQPSLKICPVTEDEVLLFKLKFRI